MSGNELWITSIKEHITPHARCACSDQEGVLLALQSTETYLLLALEAPGILLWDMHVYIYPPVVAPAPVRLCTFTLSLQLVLYGIFAVVVGGMGLSWLNHKRLNKPLTVLRGAFRDPASLTRLKEVYRFSSPEEVELCSRAMRQWDQDGIPLPGAADFGEFVIKVRLQSLAAGLPEAPS